MTSSLDGRDTRWQEHRQARREELVDATLRAVRRHGAGVTVDEIAASAGTSKTVLYRYFGDRAGLYAAVVERVAGNVMAGVGPSLRRTDLGSVAALVEAVADSYTRLVEKDPEIYTFVRNRPANDGADDPVVGVTGTIADHLAAALAGAFSQDGHDLKAARMAAHGLVGYVRAAVDLWLTQDDRMPRAELVHDIGTLFGRAYAVEFYHPAVPVSLDLDAVARDAYRPSVTTAGEPNHSRRPAHRSAGHSPILPEET